MGTPATAWDDDTVMEILTILDNAGLPSEFDVVERIKDLVLQRDELVASLRNISARALAATNKADKSK